MQAAVGGLIESYYPYDDPVVLICNEEGKINGLPLNRAIYDEDGKMADIIAGDFFIAGLGDESFCDLPAGLMEKYKEQFRHPEAFVRLMGKIVAVKMPVRDEKTETRPAPPRSSSPEL